MCGVHKPLEGLAVLVPSCDKYHSIWKPFFTLFFKQWPSFQQNLYFISNSKGYKDPRVTNVLIPHEKSWSKNLMVALDTIKEEYVLLILDDFLIYNPIDVESIRTYLAMAKKEKAIFFQLHPDLSYTSPKITPDVRVKGNNERFKINCRPGIWKKSALKKLLKDHEDAWQFESYATWRCKQTACKVLALEKNVTEPILYYNALINGYWVKDIYDTVQKVVKFETDFKVGVPQNPHKTNRKKPLRDSFTTIPLT